MLSASRERIGSEQALKRSTKNPLAPSAGNELFVVGSFQPPLGIVVLFEDFLTVRVTTGLLPLAQLPVRQERSGDDKGTRKTRGIKGPKGIKKQ
jgi:hypothetical protein